MIIWALPEKYNKAIGDEEIDYSLQYNIMDDIQITGEKPRSYIFGNDEKSVDSWQSMFIDVLKSLYEFDQATYEKFITHEVTKKRHLAEPIGSNYQFRTSQPVEICKGYLTELHFSAQDLLTFMQIAVEIYGLQDEVGFTLKRKTSQENLPVGVPSEIKIGQIVQTTFREALENGAATVEEVRLMLTKDYSKSVFNINYPLLSTERERRYYAQPLIIGSEPYYLCTEWYDSDKPYLLKWLEDNWHLHTSRDTPLS